MRPAAVSVARRQVAVVGHERTGGVEQRLLHHRVPAAFDVEIEPRHDLRPHITARGRERRQGAGDVEPGERRARRLDGVACRRHRDREAFERFQLDSERALGRGRDLGLELAELGGGEARLAGERLAVDEAGVERRRHQLVGVLRRDIDEISQHVVVPDFQRADIALLRVARLQRGDHPAQFVAQCARVVERFVIPRPDEAAVALERGQLVGESAREFRGDRRIDAAQRCLRLRDLGRHLA